MRIAINALGCEANDRALQVLDELAVKHTAHSFIVFSDKPLSLGHGIPATVTGSPVTSLLSRRWWLDVKLAAAIRKQKADVLINLHGDACLRTGIPQVTFVNDTLFLHHPKKYTSAEVLFHKFYLPKYLSRSAAIVVPSMFTAKELADRFNVDPVKIHVMQYPVDALYQPLEWNEKESVKERYTGGHEYFLYTIQPGQPDHLLTVLKAFSRFKKWQRSSMQLVVSGEITGKDITEKINTYKFRNDLVLISGADAKQLAKLTGAAYGILHFPLFDEEGSAVIAAMQSASPVITTSVGAIPEVAANAVLYADAGEESIAAQMIQLHKDETLRSGLVEKGSLHAAVYAAGTSTGHLWQLIQSIATGRPSS